MRRLSFGIVMVLGLIMVSIASASTEQPKDSGKLEGPAVSSQSFDAATQAGQAAVDTKSKALFTQTEANSLRTQGDKLLAETDAGEIKVGSIDGNDLVYVLVVVLLVVVILAVVH